MLDSPLSFLNASTLDELTNILLLAMNLGAVYISTRIAWRIFNIVSRWD